MNEDPTHINRAQAGSGREVAKSGPTEGAVNDDSRRVYISYAWGGESERVAAELDTDLQKHGITVVRDKHDLGYKGQISSFMQEIGRGYAVILVISDKYLRSPNCMFELVEVAKNADIFERIFPVVLDDAAIYDPEQRIGYIKFWEEKYTSLDKAMRSVSAANLQGLRDEIDSYDAIRDHIARLTFLLKDMNTLTPEMHRGREFGNLIAAVNERLSQLVPVVPGAAVLNTLRPGAHQGSDFASITTDENQRLSQQVPVALTTAEVQKLAPVTQQGRESARLVVSETDCISQQSSVAPVAAPADIDVPGPAPASAPNDGGAAYLAAIRRRLEHAGYKALKGERFGPLLFKAAFQRVEKLLWVPNMYYGVVVLDEPLLNAKRVLELQTHLGDYSEDMSKRYRVADNNVPSLIMGVVIVADVSTDLKDLIHGLEEKNRWFSVSSSGLVVYSKAKNEIFFRDGFGFPNQTEYIEKYLTPKRRAPA
jgi:hypothetical protein